MSAQNPLLPGSKEVPFSELEGILAGRREMAELRQTPIPRASTATIVVVGAHERLAAAAEALGELNDASGVRAILIVEGEQSTPVVRMSESLVVIDGLSPRYLNNAVAAVRLSSLPALIWWRGGSEQALEEVTNLADRLVLDIEEPDHVWQHADRLVDSTALTDLRWTRLTGWRAMLAHLFDLPQVRDAVHTFRQVTIEAVDRPSARLFAAWLISSLEWTDVDITIESVEGDRRSSLTSVRLVGERLSISVRRLDDGDCLEAAVEGDENDTRIAPLGHTTLSDCIGEELSVRSRDVAFERALQALGSLEQNEPRGGRREERSS